MKERVKDITGSWMLNDVRLGVGNILFHSKQLENGTIFARYVCDFFSCFFPSDLSLDCAFLCIFQIREDKFVAEFV